MIYLTRKQLEIIARQLAAISVKDSDFEDAEEIKYDDTVAIVQDGINKKVSVDFFRDELQNGPRGMSAYEVAVENGFEGTEAEWLESLKGETGSLPDVNEEDLSISSDLLEFADRSAGVEYGYVILRKNKTFEEQVVLANTIYEIRYAFDLSANTVAIPSGCVLRFVGGLLKNGTITGDNTSIEASNVQIFDTSTITLNGSFNNEYLPVEWFGAKANDSTFDNSVPINACISNTNFNCVVLQSGAQYEIMQSIVLRSDHFNFGSLFYGVPQYNDFSGAACARISTSASGISAIVIPDHAHSVNISNVAIRQRWAYQHTGIGIEIGDGGVDSCSFTNVKISNFEKGFQIVFRNDRGANWTGIELNNFTNFSVVGNEIGMNIQSTGDVSSSDLLWWMNLNTFINCHFSHNHYIGMRFVGMGSFEQNKFIACGFEANGKDYGSGYNNETTCGVYLSSPKEIRGFSTFDSCYFELNLPGGVNCTVDKSTVNESTSTNNAICDIYLDGTKVELLNCTFNYGMVPIVFVGTNKFLGVSISNCEFKYGTDHYRCDNILLIKNSTIYNVAANKTFRSYINFYSPYLDKGYQSQPFNVLNSSGLTYLDVQFRVPGYDIHKTWDHEASAPYGIMNEFVATFCCPTDTSITFYRFPKRGSTAARPTLGDTGYNVSGFMYFDTDLHKPVWWVASSLTTGYWVDATGTTV